MTKKAGSGSISQRHGSADPDPLQNVMDPEHCLTYLNMRKNCSGIAPVRQLRPKNSSKYTIIINSFTQNVVNRKGGIKMFGNLIVPRKLPSRESTVTLCLS